MPQDFTTPGLPATGIREAGTEGSNFSTCDAATFGARRAIAAHALKMPAESWEIYLSTELDSSLEEIIP